MQDDSRHDDDSSESNKSNDSGDGGGSSDVSLAEDLANLIDDEPPEQSLKRRTPSLQVGKGGEVRLRRLKDGEIARDPYPLGYPALRTQIEQIHKHL